MNENKTNINWYPGHMAKTKREIREKLDLIDIVYEVIDARMPISSRLEDVNDITRNKKKIIILTKYDLCDKSETDKIINSYKDNSIVIPLDLLNGDVSIVINETVKLMKEENDKRKLKGMQERHARVAIIGAPNVGKSTLINRLVGRRSVNVGNKPGVTKSLSWIRINKDVELLDTPGILWSKIKDYDRGYILASFSSIKEEVARPIDVAVYILRKLEELYPDLLKERYGIESLTDTLEEEFEVIGRLRGALQRGGVADYLKVATIVIKDLQEGRIGKVTFDRLK
jgi:ribosome biogenesis GTP-binding protein ylqF